MNLQLSQIFGCVHICRRVGIEKLLQMFQDPGGLNYDSNSDFNVAGLGSVDQTGASRVFVKTESNILQHVIYFIIPFFELLDGAAAR